jgi:hypothetical protein
MDLQWTRFSDREQTAEVTSEGARVVVAVLRDDMAKPNRRWSYRVELFGGPMMEVRSGGCPGEEAAKTVATRAAVIMLAAACRTEEFPPYVILH